MQFGDETCGPRDIKARVGIMVCAQGKLRRERLMSLKQESGETPDRSLTTQ